MNRILLILSLLLTTFESRASTNSTGEPASRWNKSEIRVCWINSRNEYRYLPEEIYRKTGSFKNISPFTKEEKDAIRDTVSSEFTLEKTGITFTGWNDCANESAPDIFLITSTREHSFYGFSPIGGQDGPSFLFISRIEPRKLSPLDTLRMFALHEFGHAAGLRHEHLRAESKDDGQCMISGTKTGEHADKLTAFLGEYDPSSIMNYCHIHLLHRLSGLKYSTRVDGQWLKDPTITTAKKINNEWVVETRIGLSNGDQAGLRKMYGKY